MDFKNNIVNQKLFSNSQEEFLRDFSEWWNTNSLTYTLAGVAGSGKTYMLRYISTNIMRNKKIAITAPTHKAVRVAEIMTGIKGRTIHSLHGLRPNTSLETFNIDNVKYESLGTIHMQNYNVVIVDECSQVNSGIFKLNELRARQYNTRIIYVGDRLQLPPIKDKDENGNPVKESLTFKQSHVFELTDIVRQEKGNPLLELLAIAREDARNGTDNVISFLKDNPKNIDNDKGIGYITLSDKEFAASCIAAFKSSNFEKDIDFCKYTAYTNDTILGWNKFVRKHMFPNASEILVKDDVLLAYQNIVDNNISPILINSEDYIVDDVYDRFSELGFREFVVHLISVTTGKTTSILIVDHSHSTFKTYYNILNQYHETAMYAHRDLRSQRWKEYYNFKNTHLVMIDFPLLTPEGGERGWVKKDIDYGYGITVHKLQGSTIENMFINLRDIIYFKRGNQYYKYSNINKNYIDIQTKLIYTALSRASKNAIILL